MTHNIVLQRVKREKGYIHGMPQKIMLLRIQSKMSHALNVSRSKDRLWMKLYINSRLLWLTHRLWLKHCRNSRDRFHDRSKSFEHQAADTPERKDVCTACLMQASDHSPDFAHVLCYDAGAILCFIECCTQGIQALFKPPARSANNQLAKYWATNRCFSQCRQLFGRALLKRKGEKFIAFMKLCHTARKYTYVRWFIKSVALKCFH